ncbi:MAG: LamB/YcsF family protein [Pyrinomonadaceae bacterium]|nr:LamB/YcsF family protein [Phycisphaerales bacterium]
MDLNCDLGESEEPARIVADEVLLDIVTSASIACTGHAGSAESMSRTVRAAMVRGVAIGAHPSYPDRVNFGRVELDMSAAAIERSVAQQIAALARVAGAEGATITHVKPHGALYHAAMTRPAVAEAIASAMCSIDPALMLVGLAGSTALAQWRAAGLAVVAEAFADRRYEPDGSLTPRTRPGALLENDRDVAEQAVSLALGHTVVAAGGQRISIDARTLCLHSDTPDAPMLAAAVREALQRAGAAIRSPCR